MSPVVVVAAASARLPRFSCSLFFFVLLSFSKASEKSGEEKRWRGGNGLKKKWEEKADEAALLCDRALC